MLPPTPLWGQSDLVAVYGGGQYGLGADLGHRNRRRVVGGDREGGGPGQTDKGMGRMCETHTVLSPLQGPLHGLGPPTAAHSSGCLGRGTAQSTGCVIRVINELTNDSHAGRLGDVKSPPHQIMSPTPFANWGAEPYASGCPQSGVGAGRIPHPLHPHTNVSHVPGAS